MFEPALHSRLFAQPPGADFPRAVVDGLIQRSQGQPPEALARVELFVNTRRMQRRLRALFDQGPARLLPRIRLVTDLGQDAAFADLPPAVSPLRRRLELSQLIAKLLEQEPDLAPRAAIYDLADSLALLLNEMQGEGVTPEDISALDVSDLSGHWARSLKFISLVERFFSRNSDEFPDIEARQRQVIERLSAQWERVPPEHPVIVAGSTGSRGATGLFMQAVAKLPQGALILPGFDFDLPKDIWANLDDAMTAEDHPQFRFARLLRNLHLDPDDVKKWSTAGVAQNPARNRLISLALRPAPVTDQWQSEGRNFQGIAQATEQVTLIEAPSPRAEAVAIALRLRKTAEDGQSAALITPDRMLTRQVTAALDRWGIEPDDSAGRPLPLTAPGRFLRHIAERFGQRLTAASLLTLLKHPLTNTGAGVRGDHLRWTRDLELTLLRRGLPFPVRKDMTDWTAKYKGDAERAVWAVWVADLLCDLEQTGPQSVEDHLKHHLQIAGALASGPGSETTGELWKKSAGREARLVISQLEHEACHGGTLTPRDYSDLFHSVLNTGEVRDPVAPHPGIMIWGTLEARVQGADLVILAGLNDGIWPELPAPDPWMNRRMRHDAGLLLPERRIGLSAHDFQQAIAAPEVVLSRAIRDAENETVPSRWLNRLTNLLSGVSEEGKTALTAMRDRGAQWLGHAGRLDTSATASASPAPRPAPCPPVSHRPKRLSVTRISRLVRDPYAIYAESILRLRPLDPLHQTPDAPLRGTILHRVLERFITEGKGETHDAARARLLAIADEVLAQDAPWPGARILWRAKLERVADHFLNEERTRQDEASNIANEVKGALRYDDLDFTLSATADRIDRMPDGNLVIYDYKTGPPPTEKQQRFYDKQLLLEAVIAEAGGFDNLPPARVVSAAYIGLGSTPKTVSITLENGHSGSAREELRQLIARYHFRAQGYVARRAVEKLRFGGDYDHLARFGEWDDTMTAEPEEVGHEP